jgi:hypothetical protein
MSTVYVKAAELLNQLLDARIFSEDYSTDEKTEIQLDDAYDALCKLEFYLVSTKDEFICMDKIDSLFDKLYKPLKKASKDDVQVQLVMDCIFYIHTCIRSRRGEKLIDEMDVSEIEFEVSSESESESESDEEMSDDESDDKRDDDTDGEESVSESDSESDEEMYQEISRDNLKILYHYITCLSEAKIFDKEIDDIVEGSDDVTVSGILSEVQDDILQCVVILSRYFGGKTDDYSEVEEMLEDIIEDLELCHDSVGKKHREQIYLLKEKIEWIYETMFKMADNDAVEERFDFFDLKGIKMRR